MKVTNEKSTPRSSRAKQLFSNKLNVSLLASFVALLITLAFVLGLVAVPNFKHNDVAKVPGTDIPVNNDAAEYAVIEENFPDPCMVFSWDDGQWYAFATRNSEVNVQVASAPNMSHWTYHDGYDAMPQAGKWVANQINDTQVWAPTVTKRVHLSSPSPFNFVNYVQLDNNWVLFYSALAHNQTRKHCIGAATSINIAGPYQALDEPIICDF